MADWETEVGLSRALWLWRESAAWHKRRTAKRKAGTAGNKTERVLVHQKGGRLGDHLDRRWMDGFH